MKTIKSLIFFLAFTTSLASAQEQKNQEMDKLIKSDIDNAKKDDLERAEKAKNEKAIDPDQAKSQEPENLVANKEIAKYMTPGAMHKLIGESAGEWNQTISTWTESTKDPVISTAKCTISMILGGRYQKSICKGKMAGKDFEGQGIIGYDNALNVFKSSWIDNLGTGVLNMKGKYNTETKTIEFTGQYIIPATSSETIVRETLKFESKSSMVQELFITKGNKETMVRQIVYKRAPIKK